MFRLFDTSSIDFILNEISFIYKNQNFIFNNYFQQQQQQQHSPFKPILSSAELTNTYSNNNYELIDPITTTTNCSNVILIKQTNDIYFTCNTSNNNNINCSASDLVYQLPPPPALPPVPHPIKKPPKLAQVDSYKCAKKSPAAQSHLQPSRKIKSKTRLTSPVPVKQTQPLDEQTHAKTKSKKHSATSGQLVAASSAHGLRSTDKKFQRNSDHTQSIKLIKENFTNLFRKSDTMSSKSSDTELIKTLENETNKNMLLKQQQQHNSDNNFKASIKSSDSNDLHSRYFFFVVASYLNTVFTLVYRNRK